MAFKYEHIFFDLDHTLWDFRSNSRKTLLQLFDEFGLQEKGIPDSEVFIDHYEEVNEGFWSRYRAREIDKITLREERFPTVLSQWEIDDRTLADELNLRYLSDGPRQGQLMPNAIETLEYLSGKYEIHLITNGFKEVQGTKLSTSGLEGYFKTITTSEEIGLLKPHPHVFFHALKLAQASAQHSIYIGDHFETDVMGSMNAGLDQVFFNPDKTNGHPKVATFEIEDLGELTTLL